MHVTSLLNNHKGDDGASGYYAQNKSQVARLMLTDDSLRMTRNVRMQRFEGTQAVTRPRVLSGQDS